MAGEVVGVLAGVVACFKGEGRRGMEEATRVHVFHSASSTLPRPAPLHPAPPRSAPPCPAPPHPRRYSGSGMANTPQGKGWVKRGRGRRKPKSNFG